MAGDKSPKQRSDISGVSQGWAAVSYLIAGMVVWGLIGALIDHFVHAHGIVTGIGIVLGAVGGIVLVVRKFGA
jgi:ATP synthase protein I